MDALAASSATCHRVISHVARRVPGRHAGLQPSFQKVVHPAPTATATTSRTAGAASEVTAASSGSLEAVGSWTSREQYHALATDYESLAKETRDAQKTMPADLAEIRKRVESIERMMREVG